MSELSNRADRSRWLSSAAPLALVVVTFKVYQSVTSAGFIWDDDGHVTAPALRSLEGLARIWFRPGATQQYYPVLHSAFWLEHVLWGDTAWAYHLLNVAWHAMAAVLFARLLGAVAREKFAPEWAWWAAGLFALHPVNVESVAWISEQKNTLSAVFYLLAAISFLRWRDSERRAGGYARATLWFLLALGSKSVTATLPAALCVMLWWREGSLEWRRDVRPLGPWFLAALSAGAFTAWMERAYIGARGAHFALTAGDRFALAGRIAWFYLRKLFWPDHLLFVYPRWEVARWPSWMVGYAVAALAITGALWLRRRQSRAPLAFALLFLGTLLPALGFINVYPFVFSYVADHFVYLAGLAVFAAAGAAWENWRRSAPNGTLPRAAFALVLIVLASLTWRQSRLYHDQETLYRATIAENPSAWLAQENLGVVLANSGRWREAAAHDQAALALNPDYAETHSNYGNVLAHDGRWAEALEQYQAALRLRPDFVPAQDNGAKAEYAVASGLANAGHFQDAIGHYSAALSLRPDFVAALSERGLAETYANQPRRAVQDLRRALGLAPQSETTHAYLGLALSNLGDAAGAAAEYREALRLNPSDSEVRDRLAELPR
ncbi:MAG TPA: tetratricopeptide repeat protein [Opitutaceae bacterium]